MFRMFLWRPKVSTLGLATLVALIGAGLMAARVLAHAALVRSEPADNAVLVASPAEIRLWFNEPVSSQFSTARLLDVNGQEIRLEGLRVAPQDPYLLVVDPPSLGVGVYSLHWKVLSEADGHFTQGLLVFGIGQPADLASAASAEERVSVPLPEVLLRWVNYILLAGMIGSLGVLQVVLTGQDAMEIADALQRGRRRILRWGRLCAWLSLLLGLGWLGYQFSVLMASSPGDASPVSVAWVLLTGTRWGWLWWARQGLLLLWIAVLNRVSLAWTWPITGGLLLVQALSGHAAGLSPNTLLAVLADGLHLLAASFWLGGLLALIVALFPELRRERVPVSALLQAGWGPFGRWAALSVGLLAATGLYSLGRQVASPDALLTTLYGQALMAKVGLVLAMGTLGLVNSMRLHPPLAAPLARWLRRPQGWRPASLLRLPRSVLLEVSLGIMVLLLVGVVTSLAPARGPAFTPPSGVNVGSLTQNVDDLVINFSVKPNQPGQNVFTLRVASQRRPPPAEVLRVILRFTYLEQEMGTTTADAQPIEPGLYRLGGGYFSLAGRWQVEVAVRRRGMEDSLARFEWVVPPAGEARPALISNRAWEAWLAPAGILLLLLVLALALAFRPRPLTS